MGQVVELWSVGTFRATFLVQEWDRLVEHFDGDYETATRAHRSLCRDWDHIWNVSVSEQTEAEEERLEQLSDDDLLDEWRKAPIESPLADLIAGEIERRNLDD